MVSTKTSQASRKADTPPKPCRAAAAWGIGLAMGLAVALWVHWEHTHPGSDASFTEDTAQEAASNPTATPRFEFYHLLTEQEVATDAELSPEAPEEALVEEEKTAQETVAAAMSGDRALPSVEAEDATEVTGGIRYLLQAGSFRALADADSLRANLALIGIEAHIQVVELPGGETWHRVRIGPFGDLQTVNQARARMASNQIEAILLRTGG